MLDIESLLKSLAKERPIFHSEADFQHAFAWKIHELHPEASIRLERRPPSMKERIYIDAWVELGELTLAIELKYPTRKLSISNDDEIFTLADGAPDLCRYDFLRDIQRLEQVVSKTKDSIGYAILLTNHSSFWTPGRKPDANDIAFRIHESTRAHGSLDWGHKTSDGTKGKERTNPIHLEGTYCMNWQAQLKSVVFQKLMPRRKSCDWKILP